jgi:arsenical pump membrane protein
MECSRAIDQRWWEQHLTIGRLTFLTGLLLVLMEKCTSSDLAEIGRTVTLPMAALLGLSIIALSVHEVGVFTWAAHLVARHSRGCGVRLFTNLYILSAVVTVFFPNDATILLFTPLVWKVLRTVQDKSWTDTSALPYLFTIVFGANAASISLVTSNPINMIYASHFRLEYLHYASRMVLPGFVSTVVCYWLLRLAFRSTLPRTYKMVQDEAPKRRDDRPFVIALTVVIGMFVSYFILSALGYDYNVAILVGSLIMLWPVIESRNASLRRVMEGLPWDAVLFVIGMFVIIFALTNSGLTQAFDLTLDTMKEQSLWTLAVGNSLLVGLGTNLINDWPMASLSSVAVGNLVDVTPINKEILIYTAVSSANLGNKILPSGSLATLIWIKVIRRMSGIRIAWTQFIRVGLIVTPLTLLAAAQTIWLEFFLFGP